MSEMFSDEDQEPQQQAALQPPQSSTDADYWKAEAQKAFTARDQARQDLRNLIQSRYDPAVVELVPPSLPPQEWQEYADKLVAFRGEQAAPVTPEPSSEEAQPEVEVPAETLAGIVNGPSGSASGGTQFLDRRQFLDLVKTDPVEAQRLFLAGKVNQADLRGET